VAGARRRLRKQRAFPKDLRRIDRSGRRRAHLVGRMASHRHPRSNERGVPRKLREAFYTA